MDNVTIKHVEEIPAYEGPNEIPGIRFKAARQALGVEAWGMNVLELDPGCEGYPEHDHRGDQQEEVYVVLRGEVVLTVGDEERVLRAGTLARVPAEVQRKLVTRDQGAAILALGGTPGQAYKPTMG